jgi:hypothetical protein
MDVGGWQFPFMAVSGLQDARASHQAVFVPDGRGQFPHSSAYPPHLCRHLPARSIASIKEARDAAVTAAEAGDAQGWRKPPSERRQIVV